MLSEKVKKVVKSLKKHYKKIIFKIIKKYTYISLEKLAVSFNY